MRICVICVRENPLSFRRPHLTHPPAPPAPGRHPRPPPARRNRRTAPLSGGVYPPAQPSVCVARILGPQMQLQRRQKHGCNRCRGIQVLCEFAEEAPDSSRGGPPLGGCLLCQQVHPGREAQAQAKQQEKCDERVAGLRECGQKQRKRVTNVERDAKPVRWVGVWPGQAEYRCQHK